MSKQRDYSMDIFKGLLVIGMVYCHVLQFYSDTQLFPEAQRIIDVVDIVTFSGFVFSFGYVGQIAYYNKPLKAVYGRMLSTAVKTLIAFYISGTYYRLFLDRKPLDWSTIKLILVLQDIPGWSEFLVSFSMIMLAGLAFFHPLRLLLERKVLFWIVILALLGTTYLPYEAVSMNQLGLLIGSKKFASFPALQYFPYYLIGMYMAKYKVGWNGRFLLGAIVSSGIFIGYVCMKHELPERFPPSLFWILSSALLVYVYFLLAKALAGQLPYFKFLQLLGQNVLIYLLLSNIMIFTLKHNQDDLILSTGKCLWLVIGILLIISFLIRITMPLPAATRAVANHTSDDGHSNHASSTSNTSSTSNASNASNTSNISNTSNTSNTSNISHSYNTKRSR
ncbi:acyltransferase family protein [Paenibacillus hexagrammi]|uniref:Acyltransferase 3 domain-containing protein n=1 Tax=Paenibacillus hexagrammi TaxID=2908839 RepID=A0ABY3SMW9_9BACL|nr:acyltransferase family protein [Paenibacillus sp. YPD9-1]UJF34880.1 hypothetical protein L0M14_06935 [Paenibacillus sp. YPD9-1]